MWRVGPKAPKAVCKQCGLLLLADPNIYHRIEKVKEF